VTADIPSLNLELTDQEASLLRASLRRYVRYWSDHARDSSGHSAADVERIRVEAGRLIWRLEELTTPPGMKLMHSDEAVEP
jgi:hypothetical protein